MPRVQEVTPAVVENRSNNEEPPIVAAPAATAGPKKTPSLNLWVSKATLDLIEEAPANPLIRGRLRNDLGVVPPKDIKTTNAWKKWLDKIFPETKKAKIIVAPAGDVPYIREDGYLVFPVATFVATQSGAARFSHAVSLVGSVAVPPDVLARGYDHVLGWLQSSVPQLVPTRPSNLYEYSDHDTTRTSIASLSSARTPAGPIDWGAVARLIQPLHR